MGSRGPWRQPFTLGASISPVCRMGRAGLPLWVVGESPPGWRAPRGGGAGGSSPVDVHPHKQGCSGLRLAWSLPRSAAVNTRWGGVTASHCTDEEAEAQVCSEG